VRGSRLVSPNGLPIVYVGRPSRWGNPYVVTRYAFAEADGTPIDQVVWTKRRPDIVAQARAMALRDFEHALADPSSLKFSEDDVRRELVGKNLACWCPLDAECHADHLLLVANGF
jgi:hypothetical protein